MLCAYIMCFIPFRNDIALMKLDSPVYNNGYVAIAELPYPGQILPNGFTCYITGWGLLASEYEKVFHNNVQYFCLIRFCFLSWNPTLLIYYSWLVLVWHFPVLSRWLYARHPAGGAHWCCGLLCVLHTWMVGQCSQDNHGVCWRRWYDLWVPGTDIFPALTIQFQNKFLSWSCGPFAHFRVTLVDLWTASPMAIGGFMV